MKWLAPLLALGVRIWDWWFNPKKQKQRSDAEADKAIAKHDNKATNKILDDGLR